MLKSKALEYVLYGFTVLYGFVIVVLGMGDTGARVDLYIIQRAGFYIAEGVLLIMGWTRCVRLYSDFDLGYFEGTARIFSAAECCFVMIGILTMLSVVGMIPIFFFLPQNVFENGAADGLIVELLIVGLIFLFYLFVMKKYDMAKRKKEEAKHPSWEKTEKFSALIYGSVEQRKKAPAYICEETEILDELVPDEADFRRHLQHISDVNPPPAPEQQWECPLCGFMNDLDDSGGRQCAFCGGEPEGKAGGDEKES